MLKTSSRIALRFSGLTAMMLVIFGVIINLIFFRFWVRQEQRLLKIPLNVKGRIELSVQARQGLREYFQDTAIIGKDSTLADEILDEEHLLNLVPFDDNRYMYRELSDNIIVRDVTRPMAQQFGLIRLSMILLVLCTIISYLLSKVFVRNSLRDLELLVDHVEKLDIRTLSKPLELTHLPKDDELRVVTEAINHANSSLHEQIDLIKRFVSHASHELKTPLMIMQTDSELALKAKTYQQGLEKNISTINHINRLLEALFLMTRGQHQHKFPPVQISLATVVKESISQIQQTASKELKRETDLDEFTTSVAHQGVVERIFTNILDNAVKYTSAGGTISVRLTPEKIMISDTGKGIPADVLEKIREPFWQADASKGMDSGFGLGLSLVKQLVKLLGWTISVTSVVGEGTTFIIYFNERP